MDDSKDQKWDTPTSIKDKEGNPTPESSPLRVFEPGELIEQRYKVIRLLGEGGMGRVYLVEQVFLSKRYALKTLNSNVASTMAVLRFQKEAKAASQLDHPGLVQVTEFGIIDDCHPFIVMEYFEGTTLAQRIKKKGPYQVSEAMEIFCEVAKALGYAHQQGLIHRDIKPSNIMISQRAPVEIKVFDFGIAKMTGPEGGMTLTKTGEIFGSPLYMSPEQCHGDKVDLRSDIYSFGCALYECLTGLPPFVADTTMATMMKQVNERPLSLREASLGTEFPQALEHVVAKMLEKQPDDRYKNMYEVATDLQAVKAGKKLDTKTSNPVNKSGFLFGISGSHAVIAILIVLLAGAVIKIQYSQHEGSKKSESIIAVPAPNKELETALPAQLDADKRKVEHELSKESVHKYFSEIDQDDPRTRIFHFPRNISLGTFSDRDPTKNQMTFERERGDRRPKNSAMNVVTIRNFGEAELQISDALEDHPELLRRFRPDEITSLRLAPDISTSASLRDVDSLKYLKFLYAGGGPLNDSALVPIGRLPELQTLAVNGTELSADAISKLPQLHRLSFLNVNGISKLRPLLHALAGGNLETLSASNCDLNDADCSYIGSIKTLKHLEIANNPGITGANFKALANLHLVELDISGCNVTPACIHQLYPLHQLNLLRLDFSKWPKADIDRLRELLPRTCHIELPPVH